MAAGPGIGNVYSAMLQQQQMQAAQDPSQAQQQQLGYTHPVNVQQRVAQNNGLYNAMMNVGQMQQARQRSAQSDVDKVHGMEADGGGLL